ncbi:MAG: DoxX family protein [Marinosulfonomonas sp.]
MNLLISLHNTVFSIVERLLGPLLPVLARFVFAAVLVGYFWNSAKTKVGDGLFGIFSPSAAAYWQIFPRRMAESSNLDQFGFVDWLVIFSGTASEFVLPLLIVIGLFTRLSSIGMIVFIVVQSLTDIVGHGADATTIGQWFDRFSGSLIMDQRTLWLFVLITLIVRGAGPLSVDWVLNRRRQTESG